MPSVFDHYPYILLRRPLKSRADMSRSCRCYRVPRIVSYGASPCSCAHFPSDSRAVRVNGITGVIHPDRVVDAYRILSVPCGVEPSCQSNLTCRLVVIRLARITDRSRRYSTDKSSIQSRVKSCPIRTGRPAGRVWGLIAQISFAVRYCFEEGSYAFTTATASKDRGSEKR